MNIASNNLKDKVVNKAISSLRKNKRIEQVSIPAIAAELDVSIEEISSFHKLFKEYFKRVFEVPRCL